MERYLRRYTGLMLYLKELDESLYAKLCAVSQSADLDSRHLISVYTGLFLGC